MARRSPDFSLSTAIADPGFTPSQRDVPALIDLLVTGSVEVRELADRALRRYGTGALPALIARAKVESGEARVPLVAEVGRLGGAESDPTVRTFLLEALTDPEPRVRARAAGGLGRTTSKVDRAAAARSPDERSTGKIERAATAPSTGERSATASLERSTGNIERAATAPSTGERATGESAERSAASTDADTSTRSSPVGQVERALIDALARETDAPARAAIVEALGKIGGPEATAALATLGDVGDTDTRTAAALRKARVRAARPAARAEVDASPGDSAGAVLDTTLAPSSPVHVWLDCRRGMLPVLLEEAAMLAPRIEHHIDGSAVAGLDLARPLDALFAIRTWTSIAFPVPAVKVPRDADRAQAIAQAIARGGQRAAGITRGPLRYRLAWGAGGKRRAEVYRIAEAAAALDPALVNDPAAAAWQVTVRETEGAVSVEWSPRVDDPRFAYRQGDVPAASHPTIAAALAFVAGVQASDVVWDPFVGSGLELCERSLRGPYAQLIGTDSSPDALAVARANLTACGAERFELVEHDVALGVPKGLRPTLVITNPPMGRRVHREADLRSMLSRFVTAAGRALAPRGRLVWVSPFPGDARDAAHAAGLAFRRGHVIDMGGFDAEIQVWVK